MRLQEIGGSRRRTVAPMSALAALTVLVTACQNGAGSGTGNSGAAGTKVTITPAGGTVRPDTPITVQAAGGKIKDVIATANGRGIEGVLSPDRTRWRSRWTLSPATLHQVTATVTGRDGKPVTRRGSFTTLRPSQTFHADARAPFSNEKVGVGMPIILAFTRPVYNQAEVEKALEVKASKTVEGAWRWTSRQEIVYRPRRYWTPGEQVTVKAHLSGVRGAKDTYGDRDLNLRFTVGDEVISTVDTKAYTMTVKRNGKATRKVPISAGRATKRAYTTTNGVHLTMSKEYKVVADSATVGIPKGDPEYYKLDLYWAIRISNSGEYVHSAPWSVADQGKRNVSHGCVNASPQNAEWFYKQTQRGDVVVVTGTDRELEWNNGWGFWQMPWEQWRKGGTPPESAAPVRPPTG
ncbi:Ig-like domain-containing protein [Actinomadura sp. SCN-SB]|uniref:L,D-transpeptidase n=1 Tax=Actinomadura sp. SCN-SB TaxID=3373092 RepID=UPI0037525E8D